MVTKMEQHLFGRACNVFAIGARVFYPSLDIELRPDAALLMSVSSIIVATNAVLLTRVEGELVEIGADA